MRLLLPFLLLIVTLPIVAQSIESDWTTTIREERGPNAGHSLSFMFDPRSVTDHEGNLYQYGFARGTGHELVLGSGEVEVAGTGSSVYLARIGAETGEVEWVTSRVVRKRL